MSDRVRGLGGEVARVAGKGGSGACDNLFQDNDLRILRKSWFST